MAGQEEPLVELADGHAGFLLRARQIVASARLDITLFSQGLDRRIYSSEEFIAPLQSFLLSHQRARLRVLVHTPALAMRTGHRLIELGRRLSSRIEFRELLPERKLMRKEFLIADETSLLIRESDDQLEARYYPHAPLLARDQRREFDTWWQESPPAAEFRDLKL
ncbi:MAG: hypothetical protein E6Q40_10160 [Cupriavidus sp.]|nr:MAG: hypothetical protein E6Q40_10160 [Cupriavidus sp.]